MGLLKDQGDKVVGDTREKIGGTLSKENLVDEGRTQSETAEEREKQYQARIGEIEDQQTKEEMKRQGLTQKRKSPTPDRSKTPFPENDHISDERKIEEQRVKHYTETEEKL